MAAAVEYDDNVFLLPESRQDSPGSPSAAEQVSRRYVDMESARDAVGAIDVALRLTGPGYGGRALEVRPVIGAELHSLNPALSTGALGVAVEQDLARDGRVRLRATATPTTFRRNYLTGAADLNGDGLIAAEERRYARGAARDVEIGGDYRHRLRKSTKASPLEAAVLIGAGFQSRRYDAPFPGRSHAGPTATARLLLDPAKRFGLDVGYAIAALGATPTVEVTLVEEGAARRAVIATVDRSHMEHTVGASARVGLSRRSDVAVEVERRARTFTSDQPTDVRYRGRRDTRDAVGAALTSTLRRRLQATARVRYAQQRLSRGVTASGDEVDDYTRLRASLGLRVNF